MCGTRIAYPYINAVFSGERRPTMIIPDYLIIDEIKRREDKKWQPETHQIPLYIPDPPAQRKPDHPKSDDSHIRKENGAIILSLIGDTSI